MSKGTAQPLVVSISAPQTVTLREPLGRRSSAQQLVVTQSVPQQVVLINPSQRLG